MKRETENFCHAYDSKEEEWAWWANGCLEHDRKAVGDRFWMLLDMATPVIQARYNAAHATEARHSPAQQQNAPEPYQPTTRNTSSPYGLAIASIGILLAVAAILVWG